MYEPKVGDLVYIKPNRKFAKTFHPEFLAEVCTVVPITVVYDDGFRAGTAECYDNVFGWFFSPGEVIFLEEGTIFEQL